MSPKPFSRAGLDGFRDSRGGGWEYVHVCIDDRSRSGFADITSLIGTVCETRKRTR